jgi:fructosamine-3-kinase
LAPSPRRLQASHSTTDVSTVGLEGEQFLTTKRQDLKSSESAHRLMFAGFRVNLSRRSERRTVFTPPKDTVTVDVPDWLGNRVDRSIIIGGFYACGNMKVVDDGVAANG